MLEFASWSTSLSQFGHTFIWITGQFRSKCESVAKWNVFSGLLTFLYYLIGVYRFSAIECTFIFFIIKWNISRSKSWQTEEGNDHGNRFAQWPIKTANKIQLMNEWSVRLTNSLGHNLAGEWWNFIENCNSMYWPTNSNWPREYSELANNSSPRTILNLISTKQFE